MANSTERQSSLHRWLASLRDGASLATEKRWMLYFERMVLVGRRGLGANRCDALDEIDIALNAFQCCCLEFQQERFHHYHFDQNLWLLLVTLTFNNAIDQLLREHRLQRGRNQQPLAIDDGKSRAPTDTSLEFVARAEESLESLLDALDETGDLTLREKTIDSISGLSTAEIAQATNWTQRTVQRKLCAIRALREPRHS